MSEISRNTGFAGTEREAAAAGKRQVLIVEDEFVNREILTAYLEPEYDVICAETGEEAREKIRAGFEPEAIWVSRYLSSVFLVSSARLSVSVSWQRNL